MQFEDRANPRYILFSYNEGGVKLVKNLHDMEFDEELSKQFAAQSVSIFRKDRSEAQDRKRRFDDL
jgi:hypothetical protein